MFKLWAKNPVSSFRLFNENTFYTQLFKDMKRAKNSVYIESPFIASSRMEHLFPRFEELLGRNIGITLVTRDPIEHDELMRDQATNEILRCVEAGINVKLETGFHHRKLAIIDKVILWEGSLNILSHSKSKEIMRRIEGQKYVNELLRFIHNSKSTKSNG